MMMMLVKVMVMKNDYYYDYLNDFHLINLDYYYNDYEMNLYYLHLFDHHLLNNHHHKLNLNLDMIYQYCEYVDILTEIVNDSDDCKCKEQNKTKS